MSRFTLLPADQRRLLFGGDGLTIELLSRRSDGDVELERISRLTGERVAHRSLGVGSPLSASVTEDGTFLLAVGGVDTNGAGGRLLVMDARPNMPIEHEIPLCSTSLRAVHYWEDGRRAFAACGDDTVIELDAELWIPIRQEPIGETCDPRGLTMSRNGTIVIVLCGTGRLLYLDRVQLSVLDSVSVGAGGSELARTADGRLALITFTEMDEIAFVDLRSRTVERRLAVERPRSLVMGGDGGSAYLLAGAPGDRSNIVSVDLDRLRANHRAVAPTGSDALALWPSRTSPVMRWE